MVIGFAVWSVVHLPLLFGGFQVGRQLYYICPCKAPIWLLLVSHPVFLIIMMRAGGHYH